MSDLIFGEYFKQDVDATNYLCRCCLSTDRQMKDVISFQEYFRDLAAIDVSVADGLPQWVCSECAALLHKATRVRRQVLRAHRLLCEYRMRCAPFPIDPQDQELSKYSSPPLDSTHTLLTDTRKGRMGFHKILQHKKRSHKKPLDDVVLPALEIKAEGAVSGAAGGAVSGADGGAVQDSCRVKEETGFSDYEDNITLEQFKSETKLSIDNVSLGSICPDDLELDEVLEKKLDLLVKEGATSTETSSKKKDKKEDRVKKKSAKRPPGSQGPSPPPARGAPELDPLKVRVITLNPEEQVRQREEESKTNLKYPFQCHLCFKGFNFEAKLQNHMNKHSLSRGTFECTLCQMYLPTSYSLSVHSLIHTRRYECVACGVRMIDRASIWLHYRTQHEGLVTRHTCDICGKVSTNYKTHRGHLRNHHSGRRPKCPHAGCGRTFVNNDSLQEHLQIHQGIKNYECSLCNKRFRTRTQIKQHQLKHSDVKQYYCVECDVRFKSEHNLRTHLQKSMKHKDRNSFKHPCLRCDKRYETAASLSHHVSVAHEGVRAHRCDTCGATLATRASLNKHVARVHQGQRPSHNHVCHTCGKAFSGKSVLVNHVRTHTGEKPFECNTCGRKFTQRTAMLTHVKLVHLKMRRSAKIKPDIPPDEREAPKTDVPLYPKEETPLFEGYFYVHGINGAQ